MSTALANMQGMLPWKIYDTIDISAGALLANYTFFINPISATKSKAKTNLSQVSRFPGAKSFNAVSLGFYVTGDMAQADFNNLLENYWWEFKVIDRTYAEGLIFMAPSGYGSTGFSNITAAATERNVVNGAPWGNAVRFDLRLPAAYPGADGVTGVYLGQNTNFQVDLYGTPFTAGAGFSIVCDLDGALMREVQP